MLKGERERELRKEQTQTSERERSKRSTSRSFSFLFFPTSVITLFTFFAELFSRDAAQRAGTRPVRPALARRVARGVNYLPGATICRTEACFCRCERVNFANVIVARSAEAAATTLLFFFEDKASSPPPPPPRRAAAIQPFRPRLGDLPALGH